MFNLAKILEREMEAAMHHLTVRKRMARAVGMHEAKNVQGVGLYAYRYETYVMVRVYKATKDGKGIKIFEERVHPDKFNLDNHELIAKLMLIA